MNAILVNVLCLCFLCGDVSTAPRYVQTTINGVPMQWQDRNIEYAFGAGFTAAQKASAKAAMAKWAAVSTLTFTQNQQLQQGIVFYRSTSLPGIPLAETRIFPQAGLPAGVERPYRAEIHLNIRDYVFHRGNPWYVVRAGDDDVDLDRLFLHEIGHAIGLKHSTDPDAVMHDPFHESQNELHADDITGVNSIYQ